MLQMRDFPGSLLLHAIFFFNDTATTEIYTLSLHDALPIYERSGQSFSVRRFRQVPQQDAGVLRTRGERSEEHTSELQSHSDLVCRLLLEKKKRGSISSAKEVIRITENRRHQK